MNATCTGRAVRRAQTLRAPTPAAVWRVTCCSLTTDPAKPKMVRHTHTHTRRRQGCSGNSSHKGHKRLELICFSVGNCSLQHNHIFMVRHPAFLQACLLQRDVLQVCAAVKEQLLCMFFLCRVLLHICHLSKPALLTHLDWLLIGIPSSHGFLSAATLITLIFVF